ncbi:HpcH/HpaI aldolase family protein [Enterovirga sp. CN4-39]|uniref:HpcH/HpaI aldolase family protein n=1 Tax=Enterovirga sp. CN4-39 TaxID=3400910 RepID=UPI003C071412
MMLRRNRVLEALAEGRPALGVATQMNSPEAVEAIGAVGYDFTYIDCEHGSFFLEGAVQMIRASEAVGLTPIIRVPGHDPTFITRVLDAGAMGVIVPNVSTRGEAEQVVAAAKYLDGDNGGRRGACPGTRASWHQTTDWPAFARWSNANTMVWVLIESPEGVANAREIAAVPGLGAVMLGPFDLAHAIGRPGEPRHPQVAQAYDDVMAAARDSGVEVVASLFSAEPASMTREKAEWLEKGARILVAGSDRRMLVRALADRLAALRA